MPAESLRTSGDAPTYPNFILVSPHAPRPLLNIHFGATPETNDRRSPPPPRHTANPTAEPPPYFFPRKPVNVS